MIFHGPCPDVVVPVVDFATFALRHATRLATKPALIDASSGQSLTYGGLAAEVRAVASGLSERGFGKGDVFAIHAPDCLEYPVAVLAVASLGGCVTAVVPWATADELIRQLAITKATLLLTTPRGFIAARPGIAKTAVREVIVLGNAIGAIPFATLSRPGAPPEVSIDPVTDSVIMHCFRQMDDTCGLSHREVVKEVLLSDETRDCSEHDIVFSYHAFFFDISRKSAWNTLATGATHVVLPRGGKARFLQTLQDERVTRASLDPRIMQSLATESGVDDFDLSALRIIHAGRATDSGEASIGAHLMRRCAARLHCTVVRTHRSANVDPAHFSPHASPPWSISGSIEACIPGTESKVVDVGTEAALGPDEPGELWIRGFGTVQSFLFRPEASAQTLTPDGWLRTGDIGYTDSAGDFFLVDRPKELIRYRGYVIESAELEAVLLSHPAVAAAVVIPTPDAQTGEVPKAFVVLKGDASAAELIAFVAQRVAPYKRVRCMEFVAEIPTSSAGKVLRRVMIERERKARIARLV